MLDSPLFKTYKLNVAGLVKIETVRDSFNELLQSLFANLPDNREFAITRTKLEEASFFAIKSVACGRDNQAQNEHV